MTTGNCAFANLAITDDKQTARIVTSLNNLANAALQKNNTVNKLVASNKLLAKALVDANTAIAGLCFLTTPATPATPAAQDSTDNPPCPAHWTPIKPEWDPTGYC
jgi:hypothetical protein